MRSFLAIMAMLMLVVSIGCNNADEDGGTDTGTTNTEEKKSDEQASAVTAEGMQEVSLTLPAMT